MTATATSIPITVDDALLRFAMRLDATLVGVVGLGVALFANQLSSLSGLSPTTEYILGAAFVAYGVVVYLLAGLPSVRTAGIGVITANVVCTVAAILVVVDHLAPLTSMGVVFTLGSAAYTAAMAVLQYFGVRRLA